VPGEHENGRRASSGARLVLRAIERQDVEGIRLDFVIVLARVQDIEIGNTVNPKDDSFAINELICSTPRTTRRVLQTSQK
jgi:predicted membrane GTPase involved in stress response